MRPVDNGFCEGIKEHFLYRGEALSFASVLAISIPVQFTKGAITGFISVCTLDSMKYSQPCISLRNAKKDFQFLAVLVASLVEIFFKALFDPRLFHNELTCTFDDWVRGLTYWSWNRPYEMMHIKVNGELCR
jgi:hypothetical protein